MMPPKIGAAVVLHTYGALLYPAIISAVYDGGEFVDLEVDVRCNDRWTVRSVRYTREETGTSRCWPDGIPKG